MRTRRPLCSRPRQPGEGSQRTPLRHTVEPARAAAARLHPCVARAVAVLGNGEPLDYQGTHYQLTLMTPDFSPEPTGLPPIPVAIAAVGEAMLRVAGEVCDGVRLHPLCSRRYLDEVCLPQIREGMRRGGRSRAHFDLHGGGFVATGAGSGGGGGSNRRGSPPHRPLRVDPHLPADPVAARARRSRASSCIACRSKDGGTRCPMKYRTRSCGCSPPAAPIAKSRARSKRVSGASPIRSI